MCLHWLLGNLALSNPVPDMVSSQVTNFVTNFGRSEQLDIMFHYLTPCVCNTPHHHPGHHNACYMPFAGLMLNPRTSTARLW